jgi:uncharacterized membrane protein YedE/YeeE
MSSALKSLVLGVVFGVALSFIGFTSWDEVHAMFTFSSLRLTITFAVAVTFLFVLFRLWSRRTELGVTPRPIHRGTIAGGVLFGAGWAISGACPSIAFVQLGQGQLGALATIAGIVVGNYVFAVANERVLHVPASNCAES